MPFDDCFFDKIIMYSVIQYLENNKQREKCIRDLIRVCKPNGYILVADIPEKKAKEEFESRVKTREESKILAQFNANRKEFDKLFEEKIVVSFDNHDQYYVDGNLLVEVAHKEGCSAKICKQDIRQPFSLTRRDLVICRLTSNCVRDNLQKEE